MKLEMLCVSCKENSFKGTDGKDVKFYNVFVAMPDGDIAKVNSGEYVKPGSKVTLVPAVKNGNLVMKVAKEQ